MLVVYANIQTTRGKQVFDLFEDQKNQYITELTTLNLGQTELKERLQIAIDAMDFEMAAAIRDVMK
jgi:protein-arginine kinase activator protein McsA